VDDDSSPKRPSDSESRSVHITFPNDANIHGTVFGGRVMAWIDELGALTAMRHARKPVVTALIDAVGFSYPIRVGQVAILAAVVTRAWTTSMEVYVTVDTEDPLSDTRHRAAEAYLTFVAVDTGGQPQPVPPVAPHSAAERARFDDAQARRERRLAARGR